MTIRLRTESDKTGNVTGKDTNWYDHLFYHTKIKSDNAYKSDDK